MKFLGSREVRIAFLVLAAVASAIPAAAQTDFYTLPGCRVYDSRIHSDPGPDGPLDQGVTYTVSVAESCGVPANAIAVALNVTVVGANSAGDLALFPAGSSPPFVGMLAFRAGRTQAVQQMVGLGTGGDLSFRATQTNPPPPNLQYQFVIDVIGYYLNIPPVLTAGGTLSYTEDDPPAVIDNTITVADSDNANLQSATVQITGNYQNGQDVLSFVDTANITGSFTAATGTLTLTGSDTLANWQTALRNVLYENTSDNPSTLQRTVTWIADDGLAESAPVTSTINVTATNDAPVLTAGGGATPTFTEGGSPVVVDAGIGVADADDTNLESATVTITNLLDTGMETLAANTAGTSIAANYVAPTLTLTGTDTLANYQLVLRSVTYENTSSNPNVAQRAIDFTVNDGDANSNTLSAPVNVGATNNQPTISAIDDQVIDEDASTGALAFTVGDVETAVGSLTVSGVSSNQSIIPDANIVFGGSGANRTVTVTPAANASGGPVTITVTVDDGSGAPNATAAETFTVTVNALNDQPTISDVADQTIDEDTSTGALAVTVGDAETAAASLTLSGTSSNQAIIPDANIVFGGSGASRTVTVTPLADTSGGPVTITLTVNDGSGAPNATATDTFTVTVNAVNDQPTISDVGDQIINEDTSTAALAVTVGDLETAPGSLTLSGSSSNPTLIPNGNIVFGGSGANRTVTVTPAANQFGGPVTITITVDDTSGAPNATASDTFTVTITSVNDQPTVTAIADQVIDEDTSTGALAFTVGDIETAPGSLTVGGSSSNPALIPNGNIVFGGSGANRTVTVTPEANVSGGPVTITITVDDTSGAPNATVVETFTVTINDVNDQPTVTAIADQVIDEDTSTGALAFTVGDIETAPGSLTVGGTSSNPALIPNANIVFGGSGANRTVTVTPAANQFGGPVTITVTVNDGSGAPNATVVETFTVTINSVNDQPTVTAIGDQVIDEDTSTGALAFTVGDIETAPGSLTVGGSSSNTTLIPNGNIVFGGAGANRTVTVTPAANQFGGPVTITVTVDDGSGAPNATVVETFTVTVNPVNDAPVLGDATIDYTILGNTQLRVGEDTPGNSLLHIRDNSDVDEKSLPSDIDGPGPLTVVPFTGNSTNGGNVVLNADGTFTYESAAGFTGTDTFLFTVTDNGTPAATTSGTVSITVSETVWYVHDVTGPDNPEPSDTGRSTNAFENLEDVAAVLTDNDFIFVFRGNSNTAPHGGIRINRTGVKLHGEGVGLTVPGFGTLIPAGNQPFIDNAADVPAQEDHGVAVDASTASLNGVEIRGLVIEGRDNGIDVTAIAGNSVGLTISNNTITSDATTGLEGVDVNANGTGTVTVTVSNNSLNGRGNAFDARTGAASALLRIDLSNNANIFSNASGVVIDGAGGSNTTITGFANNSVHPNTGGTGISINNATFDVTPGGAFQTVTGGTTVVGLPGVTNGVGAQGVVLTNVTGDLAFTDLDVFADGGAGLRVTGTGAVNTGAGTGTRVTVSAGVGIVEATGGPAVDINNATVDLQLTSLRSTTPNMGVSLVSVSDGTTPAMFSAGSGSSITASSGAGPAFNVSGGNAGISYGGTITNNGTGRAVSITTWSGDDASDDLLLSGAIDENGGGILLNGNGGSRAITFSGGMDIDTGANEGFAATSNTNTLGLHITGTNTVDTTTATALRVTDTLIGNSGLTFRSITAGTGSGSSGVGLVLDTTGLGASNGGLTVTGNGSAGSGGTIRRKTGADGSTTAGIGIFLNSTKNASFNWMQLNDFDNSAIAGRNVHGFSLQNSVVNGTIGTTNAGTEGPIVFGVSNPGGINGLQGTGLIRNTRISGGVEHNLEFYNQTGAMNLTIAGINAVSEGANPNNSNDDTADCIIEENSVGLGGDGIQIETQGTSTATIVIDRCLFRDNKSQAIQVAANDSSAVTLTIDESFVRRFDHGNEGFILSNGGNGDLTAMVSNSRINAIGGTAIFVGQTPGNASASSELHATISGNIITQPTTATNHAISALLTSTVGQLSQARVRIDGNNVTNNSTSGTTRGILVDTPDTNTSPVFYATVTNNTVSVGDNVAGVSGIVVQGRQSADTCASIGGNTVTFPNGNPGVFGLRARQVAPATYDLEQSAGCTGTAAAVLACRNPGSTTEVLGTLTVVPTGACLLPNTP